MIALFGSLLTLFFVPWLDRSKVRSARFRPTYKILFWVFVVDCFVLGYAGSQPVDGTIAGGAISLLWIARLATAYYFAHFWVLMPFIHRWETPRPIPDSIAKPVLSGAS